MEIEFLLSARLRFQKRIQAINGKLKEKEFKVTKWLLGSDACSFLGINEDTQRICSVNATPASNHGSIAEMACTIVSYAEVLKSEIQENAHSVVKTERKNNLGRAALAGTQNQDGFADAIKRSYKQWPRYGRTRNIELSITLANVASPVRKVRLAEARRTADAAYRKAMDAAQCWHNMLSNIINQADTEESRTSFAKSQQPPGIVVEWIEFEEWFRHFELPPSDPQSDTDLKSNVLDNQVLQAY